MLLISRTGLALNLFEHDSNCLYLSHLKRLISGRFILVYSFKVLFQVPAYFQLPLTF